MTQNANMEALKGVMPRINNISSLQMKRSVAMSWLPFWTEDPAAIRIARRAFVAVDKSRDGELDASNLHAQSIWCICIVTFSPDAAADILRRLNVLVANGRHQRNSNVENSKALGRHPKTKSTRFIH